MVKKLSKSCLKVVKTLSSGKGTAVVTVTAKHVIFFPGQEFQVTQGSQKKKSTGGFPPSVKTKV